MAASFAKVGSMVPPLFSADLPAQRSFDSVLDPLPSVQTAAHPPPFVAKFCPYQPAQQPRGIQRSHSHHHNEKNPDLVILSEGLRPKRESSSPLMIGANTTLFRSPRDSCDAAKKPTVIYQRPVIARNQL
jgi:hypothetical protein